MRRRTTRGGAPASDFLSFQRHGPVLPAPLPAAFPTQWPHRVWCVCLLLSDRHPAASVSPNDRHGPIRPTGVALGIATSGPQTDATGRTSSGRTRDLRERSRVLGEVRWGSGRPMESARRPSSRCRRGTPVIPISWATHICFALTPSVVAHYNRLARARPQVAVMPRGSPCTTSPVSNPYDITGSHTMANKTVHT